MERQITTKTASLFMVLSCLFFAFMQVSIRLTGGRIPIFEQLLFRNLVTLIICGVLVKKANAKFFGYSGNRKWLLARALFGYMGMFCYFYAINHLNMADANIIQKSSPLFVLIFSVWFLGEKLTKDKIIVLILCFIGTLMVIRPKFDLSVLPSLVALFSAIFAGAAYTVLSYVNKLENPNTIIFFFSLVSSLISLPLAAASFVMPTLKELFILISIGIFAGGGQIFLTLSYKYAEASEVSLYNYTSIIFAGILGGLFFHEGLNLLSLMGILLIFFSSLYKYMKGKSKRSLLP